MKKMIQKIIVGVLLLLVLSVELNATGPSYIKAQMHPISINDKGEILCRTRFFDNPSGGHYMPNVHYGLSVVSLDTITYQETYVLQYDVYPDYESYSEHRSFWDGVYESEFNLSRVGDIEWFFIRKKEFKEMDMKPFERNDTISVDLFKKERGVDLKQTVQNALLDAKGTLDEDCEKVIILYDFGFILFTSNIVDSRELSECMEARFDYPNYWGGANIGYDYFDVTGVLFLDSTKKSD